MSASQDSLRHLDGVRNLVAMLATSNQPNGTKTFNWLKNNASPTASCDCMSHSGLFQTQNRRVEINPLFWVFVF